jgi:hypothetical protein
MYHLINSQTGLDTLITLAEAKEQCRVTHNLDDSLITSLIPVAAEMAQKYSRRILSTASITSVIESYQGPEVQLYSGNVTEVTEVLLDGVEYPDFEFEPVTQKVSVSLTYNKMKVTYNCGYATLPAVVKQAILITVSTMYNSREDFVTGVTASELPLTAEKLLNKVRFYGV